MKKYLSLFLFVLFFAPVLVFAQVQSTVSKEIIPKATYKPKSQTVNTTTSTQTTASKVLKLGMTNPDEVSLLQGYLLNQGFFPAEIPITGYFGKVTERAVKDFQNAAGLKADGVVGQDTLSFMKEASSTSMKFADPKTRVIIKNRVTATKNVANNQVARIPLNPKGVLTNVLTPTTGLQASASTLAQTAKPKLSSAIRSAGVYFVTARNVATNTQNTTPSLSTNFASGQGSANARYVCAETSDNTQYCKAVDLATAAAIDRGEKTAEEVLLGVGTSSGATSNEGDIPCLRCYCASPSGANDPTCQTLGLTGNPWWEGGQTTTTPPTPIPPVPNPGFANIDSVCMDYKLSTPDLVTYQVKFTEPVEVVLKEKSTVNLLVKANFNESKVVKATFAGYGDVLKKSVKFTTRYNTGENARLSDVYYQGEASFEFQPGTQIKAVSGKQVNLDFPDIFRFDSRCGDSNKPYYDIVATDAVFRPALEPNENVLDRRVNIYIDFREPVRVSGSPRLLINPRDGGPGAIATYRPSKDTTNRLRFHLSYPKGTYWNDLIGPFMIDLNGGAIKFESGLDVNIAMQPEIAKYDYPCTMKYPIISVDANFRPPLEEGENSGNMRADYFVNFETPVRVSGNPRLEIYNLDIENGMYTPKVTAYYRLDNLTPGYTPGAPTTRLRFHANHPYDQFEQKKYEGGGTIYLNGGSIKDETGADMNLFIWSEYKFDNPATTN